MSELHSRACATWPKTTCLASRCGVRLVVMKNCEPFVLRPALAIESSIGFEWRTMPFSNSSANLPSMRQCRDWALAEEEEVLGPMYPCEETCEETPCTGVLAFP